MIRVLFYTSYPPASFKDGGGALAIWYAAHALAQQQGIDLTIVFPKGDHNDEAAKDIAPAKLVPIQSEDELPGLLERLSPDVFHTMRSGSFQAMRFCRKHRIPSVYEVHSATCYPCRLVHKLKPPYHRQWRLMLDGRSDRKTARLASHVIVPSRTAMDNLVRYFGISSFRSSYLYNGVDTDIFYPPATRPYRGKSLRLINAGRITKDRNFDLLLKVFEQLRREFPNLTLDIAGDGDELPAVRQLCKTRGIGGVTFHGSISHTHLASLYREADFLLNTSECESFGMVVSEAMACGLPVVCFKAGALNEVMDDGVTGFLCTLKDCNDLQKKARQLILDQALRHQMGDAAAQSARRRFSWRERAEGVVLLYQNLLGQLVF